MYLFEFKKSRYLSDIFAWYKAVYFGPNMELFTHNLLYLRKTGYYLIFKSLGAAFFLCDIFY